MGAADAVTVIPYVFVAMPPVNVAEMTAVPVEMAVTNPGLALPTAPTVKTDGLELVILTKVLP